MTADVQRFIRAQDQQSMPHHGGLDPQGIASTPDPRGHL
jgi:hypothetical protein